MSIELDIVEKVVRREASAEEIELCNSWRAQSVDNEQLFAQMERYYDESIPGVELTEEDMAQQWHRLEKSDPFATVTAGVRRLMLRVVSVAAVLLVVVVGVKMSEPTESKVAINVEGAIENESITREVKQLITNTDEVTLTTNSETIKLDSASGKESKLVNAKVNIGAKSLAYVDSREEVVEYHTLTIPKKKNFSITLADGTVVHLNANTKITYPSSFKGASERRVQLEGEAYFEVAHNEKVKFIVETGGVEVTVHGTKFNVNTYKPGITETVLVEGSVSVKNGAEKEIMLKPNQLANCSQGKEIVVKEVDVANYTAWREGIYAFYEQSLYSIVTSIASWYGYDVVFETEAIARSRFICNIPRYETIEEVMNVLMMSDSFKYKITGNVIVISAL